MSTLTDKRSSLIENLNLVNNQLADFEDFSEKAKKKRAGEILAVNDKKIELETDLKKIDEEIIIERNRVEQEKINASLTSYMSNWLSNQGVSVSNWQHFVDSYDKVSGILKSKNVKFSRLSDEVLKTESENNANTIASWFSGLTFEQKTKTEEIFKITNELTGLRLKTGNVKNALVECFQNAPNLIDGLDINQAQKMIKFFISRTRVKSSGVTSSRSNGNSMSSKVNIKLNELGEGTHQFENFQTWYNETIEPGKTTTAIAQLTFNCRKDKNSKYEMSKKGDDFTLTLR